MFKHPWMAAILVSAAAAPAEAVSFGVGSGFACPAGVCEGGATQSWFARARNFDSSADDFELGVGTDPQLAFLDTQQLTWNSSESFALAYDATTRVGSITIGQSSAKGVFNGNFNELFIQFKNAGDPSGDFILVTLENLFVDGSDVGTGGVSSIGLLDGPPGYIRFFGFESALADGFTLTGSISQTGVPSMISSEALTIDFILAGNEATVPEPAVLGLFGIGFVSLIALRRHHDRSSQRRGGLGRQHQA